MADELWFQSVAELSRQLAARAISSVELTRAYLERIDRLDTPPFPLPAGPQDQPGNRLASVTTVVREQALAEAAAADRALAGSGPRSPLHGIPYGVKDLLDTRGTRTTWGSRVFAARVPDCDACRSPGVSTRSAR